MSREKELAKNTFIIALGTFLPKLTTLVTLPILTAYLTKAEYGTYDLINTLVSVLLPIIVLKLDMGIFRFLIEYRGNKDKEREIVSTAYMFILPMSILSVLVMFFLLQNISVMTKWMICLYFLLDVIYSTTQQVVRGLSKNLMYSISAIIYSVVNMLFIVLFLQINNRGLNGLLVSMNIAAAVSILFLLFTGGVWKYFGIYFSKLQLKEMLSYSWPLIPNSLSMWVMNLSDRLIVTAILGVEVNAVYAVANKIPNLLNLVQGSFSAAWMENASLTVKSDDTKQYYSSMFDILFRILIGGTAGLFAIMPMLFKLLIRGDYDDAYCQMPILLVALFFSALASFLGGIYAAHKKTKSVGITTIIAAGCNVVVHFGLINIIGLYAASFSTLISYFLLVIYRMISVRKFQEITYNIKMLISYLLMLLAMGIIASVNTLPLNIVNFVIGIAVACVTNKTLLRTIFGKARCKVKKSKGN